MLLLDAVTSVGNVWHFSSRAVVLRGIRLWSTPTDGGYKAEMGTSCNGLLDALDRPILKQC